VAGDERNELGLATWAMFLRTHAAVVSRLEREMDHERRLPLAWYDVLLELNAAPDRRLRMQDLGNRVVLSRSRVSRIVDELTRAGFTRREPDPIDRRGSHAVLTHAGRDALRSAAPIYLRGITEHFTSHLDDRQLRTVHDALARVLEAQDASNDGPRPAVSPGHPRYDDVTTQQDGAQA
jgi:DNA-binding MarR family transcriptional regulator